MPGTAAMDSHTSEAIDQESEYIQHLGNITHPRHLLRQRGYVFEQLNDEELENKKRCLRCCRVLLPKDRRRIKGPKPDFHGLATVTNSKSHLSQAAIAEAGSVGADKSTPADNVSEKRCRYHPGQVAYRKWTCCDGVPMSPPCYADSDHTPRPYAPNEIKKNWEFFRTPRFNQKGKSPALAVTIDCEMGTADSGESELIRVSVIDYFSGTVLLDKLVFPDTKMKHYNTKFSGISRQEMQIARKQRTCLLGRENARKAIWRHVGPETIIVGHATNSDLTSLRWIHPLIIDTLFIEETILRRERAAAKAAAQEKNEQNPDEDQVGEDDKKQDVSSQGSSVGLSLKALTKDRLQRDIQIKGKGHDSVEDALATRDLLHWHMVHRVMSV